MLGKGKSPEQIKELTEEPLEYIYQVQEQMQIFTNQKKKPQKLQESLRF